MSDPLRGRTVVVTGASSGIGRALARALVGRGARVIAAARSADKLATLAAELGAACEPVTTDVADAGRRRSAWRRRPARSTRWSTMPASATSSPSSPRIRRAGARPSTPTSIGALLVARALLPGMLAAGRGADRQRRLGERRGLALPGAVRGVQGGAARRQRRARPRVRRTRRARPARRDRADRRAPTSASTRIPPICRPPRSAWTDAGHRLERRRVHGRQMRRRAILTTLERRPAGLSRSLRRRTARDRGDRLLVVAGVAAARCRRRRPLSGRGRSARARRRDRRAGRLVSRPHPRGAWSSTARAGRRASSSAASPRTPASASCTSLGVQRAAPVRAQPLGRRAARRAAGRDQVLERAGEQHVREAEVVLDDVAAAAATGRSCS